MKLFKYQPINKLTLTNLSKAKNWISDPLLFNDPFELKTRDILDYNDKDELVYMDETSLKNRDELLTEIEKYGVICYSTNEVNQLLWAHYGDSHKGMCLVFDVPKEKQESIKKVEYQDILPKIDFSKTGIGIKENLIKLTSTKAKHWSYEEEYREIFIVKNQLIDYPGELVEIVFGCHSSFDDIELAFHILKPAKTEIKVSRTFIQKGTFLMGISSIPRVAGSEYKIPLYWNKTVEM